MARTLQWVLKHQTATLLVTVGDPGADVICMWSCPRASFPVQDTGVILGISEAPRIYFVRSDGGAAAGTGEVILQGSGGGEPVVIHRRGWDERYAEQRAHSDQPEAAAIERKDDALGRSSGDCSRESRRSKASRLHAAGAGLDGGRSREPHAISILASRMRIANELAQWTPKLVEKLQTLPELRDVASDQQKGDCRTNMTIDRDTASRLGIISQAIDNTLYDAFGQRQVSTIFTQLNQYHVVLEVLPNFAVSPET